MKKLIIVFPLLLLAVASCKKDYLCSCTDTYTYDGETEVDTYSYEVKRATKQQAQTACHEAPVIYQDGNESEKTECVLSKK